MSNYVLSCCSTADLSKEHFDSREIYYLCFHYTMDGVERLDDLGQSMPFDQFYAAMVAGADTKTSQVNVSEYTAYFIQLLQSGKDVLHVSLSSGLSGSYRSALMAAATVAPAFPGQKLYIVDSLGASSGYGLLMETLADKRDEGMDIDALRDWTEANKLRLHHWFFSTDLSTFVRGGRISKTSAVFGGLLEICPLLNVDHEGRLIPRSKIRTKKKVIPEIVKRMEQFAENGLDYSGKCYISNSACHEDAQAVAALIEERFPKLDGKVEIYNVGTTIGSHTGPGTVALFFWGSQRVD